MTPSSTTSGSRPAILGPALLAVAALALHAACWGRYGVFRDELYFIVCGERLAWGYVDQPPGIAAVAALAHGLFGTWVPGLRLLAWLASAATVYAAGRLAARLGAGPFGASLAAAATLGAPVLIGLGHYLTMNAFEPLLLVALATVLLRLARGEDPRLWMVAAGIAGVAVLFKYTAALLALSFVAGLLLFPERRALRARWALLAAAFGLLVVLPNLAWQASHGFPFLELVRNGARYKNAAVPPGDFALELLKEPNPVGALVWIPGVLWLLGSRRAGPARFLAVGAILYVALLLATKGKPYYAAPAFPVLFAAGGAAWDGIRPRALRVALPAALVLSGVALAPLLVPLLPEETFVRYQAALGQRPPALERLRMGPLPQILADQHGLAEIAAAVAAAYRALPREQQRTAGIFAQNYGEAAAIDVLAEGEGLPPASSGHNTYWLWGPPAVADPLLVVGGEGEDCGGGAYRTRTLAARVPDDPWAMPYERGRLVWICRGLDRPIAELWPRVRHYE
ncbi:MAG TPA: glycosyltransferase family 39 protein [Anaeromyxobacter sp.]